MKELSVKKKPFFIRQLLPVFLICSAAAIGGCDKTISEVFGSFGRNSADDQDTVKLNSDRKFYNDYLGISYVVPKGWWLYSVAVDNFSSSKGDIKDNITMDIDFGKFESFNYSNIWLTAFGNLEHSSQDNHLGFSLDARSIEGIHDISGFMNYFETVLFTPFSSGKTSVFTIHISCVLL